MAPEPNTSVDQIFDTLHLLVDSGQPSGVADVARDLGIPTSTAHRLLATINDAGFAVRDSTGTKYELGVRSHMLVHGLFRQFRIQHAAVPFLARLAKQLGETTALDVRVGWHVVRIAGFEGWNEVHAGTRIGQASPLAATAGGLAVLAHLPDDAVDGYLRWEGGGRRSPTRGRALRARLAQVAEHGWAREAGEDGDGAELAFPVRHEGRAFAALCVDGTGPIVADPPRASDVSRARKVVEGLERAVAHDPALAHDPFAHLDADEIAATVGPPRAAGR